MGCNQAPFAQKSQEDANTTDDMSAVIARCTRAPAAQSMPIERRDTLIIHRLERNGFELEPDPKVRDRAKM
jgi:hypothetical protein